ncbi:MAG: hypothetical protein H0X37_13880 [Herpetosiphonaceae bacterium]|nr:hypothetical protein [Herpetosiphonaceae bacterium]
MRKKMVKTATGLAGLFLGVTLASAAALPGSGWFTSASIQNIDPSAATNVSLTAYGGSTTYNSATFSLPAGKSVVFFPGHGSQTNDISSGFVDTSPTLPGGFTGGMVVSSAPAAVAAIAQVANNQVYPDVGTPGGEAAEQYRGSGATTSTILYPTVKNDYSGKTTLLAVQAASNNVNYTATITDNAGGTHTKTGAITADNSILLGPSDFSPAMAASCSGDANTVACIGSVNITATGGNIAGAIMEYQTGVTPAILVQSTAMFTTSDAGSTVNCPSFKNAFNSTQQRTTGITVQNTGSATATVNLTLTGAQGPATGHTYTSSISIPAGASRTFSPFSNNIGNFPAASQGSAQLTASGGSLIANVNEQNFGTTPVKATTYSCSSAAVATNKIAFPQVKKNYGDPSVGTQATTGLSIQNVDTSAANLSAVYACNTGTFTVPFNLPVGQSYTFFQPSQVPDNSLCAATVTSTGGKIIGVAQETTDFSPGIKLLNTKNYEGINE